MTYAEKLRHPKWQKKRLEIFERDKFTCTKCGDTETELQVHHLKYTGEPWDAPNEDLVTVCKHCHPVYEDFKSLCDKYRTDEPYILKNFKKTHNDGVIEVISVQVIGTETIIVGYNYTDNLIFDFAMNVKKLNRLYETVDDLLKNQ